MDQREPKILVGVVGFAGEPLREPWVLEGLSHLHHPLRAASSEKYVQPGLDLLWDVQKTGDIFFPKRWLDSTLGGHQSAAVAKHGS